MKIKRLETEYFKNGYTYRQIKRSDTVALYEQVISPTKSAYEVFKIKTYAPRKCLARIYQDRGKSVTSLPERQERFPTDEDFGKTAFTYTDLEEAHSVFGNLQ